MSDQVVPTDGEVRPTRTRSASGGAASGAKIVVAGLAVGAGLMMVGTMAATAQLGSANDSPPANVHQVVVVPEDLSNDQLMRVVASRQGLETASMAPLKASPAGQVQAESGAS